MEISNLSKEAENLFNQQKFEDIIALLTDAVLKEKNNAELFAWRARANHRLTYDVDITMLFADKAIITDQNYFMGYFVKACAYDDKREDDSAIEAYTKAIERNPDFAEAYNRRGLVWVRKKENDKAIEDFEKAIVNYSIAIDINPNNAELYLWRGNTWYYKEDYDNAIADYNNAIANYEKIIDHKPNYADAYYNRGLTWFAKKEYNNAIADYTKVIDHQSDYADAYYVDRGNAWFAKKEYDKAIADYSEAISKNPTSENTYYSRGLAKKENDLDLEGSKQDFERYLGLTIYKNEIWAKYAKYDIECLDEKIRDPHLSSIKQIVNNIKNKLLIKEECVHFTTFSTLRKLILKESKFRIYEGNFMNDPSEGKEFFNYLEYKPYTSCENGSLTENFSPKPFIGSFVTKDKYNDLNMWRFYGKEDGVEAKGCAITLCTEDFIENIKNFLSNEKKEARQDNESDINFYRVVYLTNGAAKFYISDSDRTNELEQLIEELKQKVKSYKGDNKTFLEKYLNSISFLFKSDVYKNENEVRLVVKGIEFEKICDMKVTPPKVYIELVPIKKLVKKITLGPKVDKVNEWASAFHYIYEENAPEIVISHLPYR